MRKIVLLLLLVFAFSLSACAAPQTNREKGTAIGVGVGAATGAILGQAIGGNTTSTVLGAVAGAAAGGIAGNMIGDSMDRQEQELNRRLAHVEGASVRREQNVLHVTFRSDVLFDVDSTHLRSSGYDQIAQIAGLLRDYPETRVRVNGHTDSTGSESHNQELSERRAQAVKTALTEDGVAPRRVVARGHGELRPVASNATETGRQMNRRVTLEIIPERR